MSEPTPSDTDIASNEPSTVEDGADRKSISTSDSVTSWPPVYRSRLDVLVLSMVVVAFWVVAGVEGALVGVALAATRLFLPTIAVYALGFVAATAMIPTREPLVTAALPVAAVTGLLLTTSVADDWMIARLAVVLITAGLTGVGLAVFLRTEAVWLASVTMAAVAGAGFVTLATYRLIVSTPADGESSGAIHGQETDDG